MPTPSRRPPCQGCHKPTKRPNGWCVHCDPAVPEGQRKPDAKRPERPCKSCRKRTTAKTGMCRACTGEGITAQPVTHVHALRGGRWVRKGLTQVWEPLKPRKAA